jgi:hypothetical protein
MKSFYSVFGKKNRVVPFFVWLKSRIKRSHSILCLVREPYRCRGEERRESAHVRESARIRSFLWSGNILINYSKFSYIDLGADPLLFCWKPTSKNLVIPTKNRKKAIVVLLNRGIPGGAVVEDRLALDLEYPSRSKKPESRCSVRASLRRLRSASRSEVMSKRLRHSTADLSIVVASFTLNSRARVNLSTVSVRLLSPTRGTPQISTGSGTDFSIIWVERTSGCLGRTGKGRRNRGVY